MLSPPGVHATITARRDGSPPPARGLHPARKNATVRIPRVAAIATVLWLSGCAAAPVVTDANPATPPYTGPLYVEVPDTTPQDADRSGAAGLVVQCRFGHEGSSAYAPPYEFKEAGKTPELALRNTPNGRVFNAAKAGLIRVRTEPDRVLYTYEVDGVTKLAAILHHGPIGFHHERTGWYLESEATCDPAEFPDPAVIGLGQVQIWTDPAGQRAPAAKISSFDDNDNCVPGSTWLDLDRGQQEGGRTYVRGAGPDLKVFFDEDWVPSQPLPASAVSTGYSRNGRSLWLSPDGRRAFVGAQSDDVEMWPGTTQPLGCA